MIENRYQGLFCAINDQVKIRNGNDTNLMKTVGLIGEMHADPKHSVELPLLRWEHTVSR